MRTTTYVFFYGEIRNFFFFLFFWEVGVGGGGEKSILSGVIWYIHNLSARN